MIPTLIEIINGGLKPVELPASADGFFLPFPGLSEVSSNENSSNTSEELRVLVHPYNPNSYLSNEANPEYEEKRDELVRTSPDVILIGLENIRLPVTIAWLTGLQPQGPRIVYTTRYCSAQTLSPPQDGFAAALARRFRFSRIRLGGAELHLDPAGNLRDVGCVNRTYRFLLEHFPVVIDRDSCWKTYREVNFDSFFDEI